MAKIQIKSDKVIPFEGIFSVMENFSQTTNKISSIFFK